MSPRHHSLAVGLLTVLAAQPGLAAPANPFAQSEAAAPAANAAAGTQTAPANATAGQALLEQGRYWQARNNAARAQEAWGRLLLIDPTNAEGLYNMGLLELDAKRAARARDYLTQLQKLGSAEVYAAQLDQEIRLRDGTKPKDLEKARLLATSGELDKAVAQYRTVFGNQQPHGKIALEYYGYLGYTDGGWEESRQGLERLQRESPGEPTIGLVLAKLLIRNETTRADGIRRLSLLANRPDIGGDATESWRLALTWYGVPRPAEKPLFEAYLKAHPDDTEIRDQYRSTRDPAQASRAAPAPVWKQDASLANGFKALEAGDMVQAEANFVARLKVQPNDADALGGLGSVRLRQDRPDEAVELLTRASRQPGNRTGWKNMLATAQYWSLNGRAEQARARGDFDNARQLLNQAIKLDSKDLTAETALGRVQAESGQLAEAEQTYRRLLARDPGNALATEGLVNVLAQNNRADEALRLIDSLPADRQGQIASVGQLRAAQARGAAKTASARGDDATAQRLLEDALRFNPDDPWLRLDLARVYLKSGNSLQARGVVDGLLLTHPDMPGALMASALMSSELQDWPAALSALERISPQNRTREVQELQKRAWLQNEAAQAVQMARLGNKPEALAILARLEPEIGQNPDLLGTVSSTYADIGESTRALSVLRQAAARSTSADNSLLLQYAGVLLKTEQDAEAAGVLRQLQSANLTETERRNFEGLRKIYTVRQAEALRGRGKLADAYDMLAPMLDQYPDDPLVVGALARMYGAANDGAKATGLYKQLLRNDPENTDLLVAAAQTATQAKDYDYANSALDTALSLKPQDPEVLGAAARVYRSQGKSGKAAEYLKLAIAAQTKARPVASSNGFTNAPSAAPQAAADQNPFARLPGQTRSNPPAAQQYAAPAAQSLPVIVPVPSGSYGQAAPAAYSSSPVFGNAPSSPSSYGASSAATPAPRTQPPGTSNYGSSNTGTANRAAPSQVMPLAPAIPAAAPVSPRSARPEPIAAAPRPVQLAAAGDISYPIYPSAPVPAPMPGAFSANAQGRLTDDSADAVSGARSMEAELAEIQQARSATVTVGTTIRQHNGDAGMGRILDVETPVTVQFPLGENRASIQVTPVTLNAGTVDGSVASGSRFGAGPAAAVLPGQVSAGRQRESGVGVAVGYEMPGVKLDVGTTPIGFRYQNIVGGAAFSGAVEADPSGGPRFTYGAEVSRRAVTDSVLSFAGARDSRTGDTWGGVTSTGGTANVGLHWANNGFYARGGWHSQDGHNVDSNSSLEGTAGAYMHLIRQPNRVLTTGLNLTSFSYDKNQSNYTYGSGGYFSPQRFVALSVPMSWAERQGRFSYLVKGSIGVQNIRQDAVPYYSDPVRQANAEAANGGTAMFPGQSKTGVGYGLAAGAEYQIGRKWYLGGNIGVDNARDYRQFSGGVYLRYAMEEQNGQMALPMLPLASPYTVE
ncbi:tetratricopeptide repeat protein [Pigmentiphaga aceris]|uniref:Tetratricopeptide repeat protein n=1 Tax=Pigmentiphaga aceris TaxID=1940612 RepID=A0A5C0B0C4_9BURK|nr:cellulose biosynthesis protein BcsC [Pigmentiphaga aceris]QEI07406.1 tetratricopeptide repeat protein [Pigmentiphaga aceris]